MQQLSLFSPSFQENVTIPSAITRTLEAGAVLAVSLSGGKDSDAMLKYLVNLHAVHRWSGELFAITADLGRIEWLGTLEHIQALCDELNVPLVVVKRQKGGMIERWEQRRRSLLTLQQVQADTKMNALEQTEKEGSKPFWSSASARYCTKELKTAVIDRYLRKFKAVVCAVGIRAQESASRAKKPHVQVRNDIAAAALKADKGLDAYQHQDWADTAAMRSLVEGTKGRLALTWNPILNWSVDEVWRQLGTSTAELARRRTLFRKGELLSALQNWPAHWAYVSGNSRLSCSMCVLASAADIHNGAQHNPRTWLELALMETSSGWSFQQNKWLADLPIRIDKRVKIVAYLNIVLAQLGLIRV